MGKNNRHRKEMKSEKAKVKLKGKKLAKASNVTDTNFKIKKIVIPSQRTINSVVTEEDWIRRNFNIKDVISRLNHYNVNARLEALYNIKDAIEKNAVEALDEHLHALIESISKLSLDSEQKIRRASFKVLRALLNPNLDLKVAPFFHILTSYLCCAMTHINVSIQEDALLYLDVLLETHPDLFSPYFMKVLPCFLDLVSKLQTDSKMDRKLSMNLHSKFTMVKWRVKVLHRLHDVLKNVLYFNSSTIGLESKIPAYDYNPNIENYRPIVSAASTTRSIISHVINKPYKDGDRLNSDDVVHKYITSLMPLLFESWMEIRPGVDGELQGMNDECADILKSILDIIRLIWSLLSIYDYEHPTKNVLENFVKEFSNRFLKLFVANFPYTQVDSFKLSKEPKDQSLFCIEDNLSIVFLYLVFNSNRETAEMQDKIFKYLRYVLTNWNRKCTPYNDILDQILRQLLECNFPRNQLTRILNLVINNFMNNRFDKAFSNKKILPFLCDIAAYSHLKSSDVYMKWLEMIPSMLTKKNISSGLLETTAKLCRQNNQVILTGIKSNLDSIVANLHELCVAKTRVTNGISKDMVDNILFYASSIIDLENTS